MPKKHIIILVLMPMLLVAVGYGHKVYEREQIRIEQEKEQLAIDLKEQQEKQQREQAPKEKGLSQKYARSQEIKLQPSEPPLDTSGKLVFFSPVQNSASFGRSFAMEGNLLAITAPEEDSKQGAVYLYKKNAENKWQPTGRLTSPHPQAEASFGNAVSISGARIAIAAPKESGGGSVYLFEKSKSEGWESVARIQAVDPKPWNNFGQAIALDGNQIVISQLGWSELDKRKSKMAVIFELQTEEQQALQWRQTASIPSLKDDYIFARDLEIENGIVAISYGSNTRKTALDDLNFAYIYEKDEKGKWVQAADLHGIPVYAYHMYGSINLNEGRLVGGSSQYFMEHHDINMVYLFEKNEHQNWKATDRVFNTDVKVIQWGHKVALSGSKMVVNAWDQTRDRENPPKKKLVALLFEQEGWQWKQKRKIYVEGKAEDRIESSFKITGNTLLMRGYRPSSEPDTESTGFVYLINLNSSLKQETMLGAAPELITESNP